MSSFDDLKNDLIAERAALLAEERRKRDADVLNEQAKAYQRAQVEQAQRVLDASMSPEMQRVTGLGALESMRYSPLVGTSSGVAIGAGVAQHNPQKTFTRAEVLAVLRARKAMLKPEVAQSEQFRLNEVSDLIAIFERME